MANKYRIDVPIRFKTDLESARKSYKKALTAMNLMSKDVGFGGYDPAKGMTTVFSKTKAGVEALKGSFKGVFTGFVRGSNTARDAQIKHNYAMEEAEEKIENVTKAQKHNLAQVLRWAIGWQLAYGALNFVKSSIFGTIKDFGDLEMAMIRIKFASGDTNLQLKNFTNRVYDVAYATGTSATEISKASKIWAQQGKTVSESLKLTEIAAKASNISGQDMSTTISNLTGIMKAWNLEAEDLTIVLDKFTAVAEKEAIEIDVLEDGFLRLGPVAKQAGVTFNELIGIITATHVVTRRTGTELGTAFKTIMTRYLRQDMRDMIQNLAQIPVYMDAMGRSTMANTGRMRGFGEIMQDLSVSMKGMSETTRNYVLEQLSGIRRISELRALFENFDTVIKISTQSSEAYQQANKLNNEIMKSWQKSVTNLGNALSELGQSLAQSGVMVFLTGVVKGLTNLTKAISSAVSNAVALAGIFASLVTLTIAASLDKITKSIIAYNAALIESGKTMKSVAVAAGKLTLAMSAVIAPFAAAAFILKKMADENYKYADSLEAATAAIDEQIAKEKDRAVSMRTEELIAVVAKTNAERLRAQTAGEKDYAIALGRTLKVQKEVLANKIKGIDLTGDERLEESLLLEALKVKLHLLKEMGVNEIRLRQIEMEGIIQAKKGNLEELEGQKLLDEVTKARISSLYELRDAYQDVVVNGIEKMIEGEGTLQDMAADFTKTWRKSMLEGIIGQFQEKTNIFGILSAATKNPIVAAHENGTVESVKIYDKRLPEISKKSAEIYCDTVQKLTEQSVAGAVTSDANKNKINEFTAKLWGDVASTPTKMQLDIAKYGAISANTNVMEERIAKYGAISIDRTAAEKELTKSGIFTKLAQTTSGISGADYSQANKTVDLLSKANEFSKTTLDEVKKQTGLQTGLQSAFSTVASLIRGVGPQGAAASGAGADMGGAISGIAGGIGKMFEKPAAGKAGAAAGGAAKPFAGIGMSGLASAAFTGLMIASSSQSKNVGTKVAQGALGAWGAAAMMMPDPSGLSQIIGGGMLLASMFMGGGKNAEKPANELLETSKQITSKINVTNKNLEIINRNLIGIRRGFEGFVMQESAYLRSRSRLGVNVQNEEFALNSRRGMSNA